MLIQRIRESRFAKGVSLYLVFEIFANLFHTNAALALTGGPSQPEVESFTPVGTTEMVDAFSGDFNYNIPLLDVGGYPVNISYNSGITADQEASWVGLGWNLNVGTITRNMRALPDDFSGDKVIKESSMRDNINFGASVGASPELFGAEGKKESPLGVSASFGVSYNNYNGVGFQSSITPTISLSLTKSGKLTGKLGVGFSSSENGINVSPSLSLEVTQEKADDAAKTAVTGGLNIGASFNSRQGLTSINSGLSISRKVEATSDAKKNPERTDDQAIGSSVSFVNNTYNPQMQMSRQNFSLNLKFSFDASFAGGDISFPITGYYSEDKLVSNNAQVPAYGYLYMQNSNAFQKNQQVLLDFNREKDQSFTQNTPNLPVTNFTYDQYQVTGQGVAGQYRPYRSDVGYVYDSYNDNRTISGSAGVEIGIGNLADIGVDIGVTTAESYSGNWIYENDLKSKLQWSDWVNNDLFEPAYFRQVGEMSVESDPAFRVSTGGTKAIAPEIVKSAKFIHKASGKFKDVSGTPYGASNNSFKRTARAKRNQVMTFLTSNEISLAGIEKYVSPNAKGHHIGEIDILRPDGARYIYGIPAYNIYQRDVTFNISGQLGNCETGLVPYTHGTDNTSANSKGRDHYYQSEEIPAFAHSYLLTSVISSDYVDVDGISGPSEGDLGTYTKFNYDANTLTPGIQPKEASYLWRIPYSGGQAAYNEGFKGDAKDDMASYSYGIKELWYLQTIETKTHVAVFKTSVRRDAKGVHSEAGGYGANSASMHKLESIQLYSRESYKRLLAGENVKPLKTVHFEYDYSLCKEIENNSDVAEYVNNVDINANHGKLTLRRIYFTYEGSNLGKLSPYKFTYGDQNHDGTEDASLNEGYNLKNYDRWGNYKPNTISDCTVDGPVTAAEFPYVSQDQATADRNTAMWTLTDIQLPSGGKISVDFESNDYAYVQDKPALDMIQVAGMGNSSSFAGNNLLWHDGNQPEDGEQNFVYFPLPPAWRARYNNAPTADQFRRDFLGWITEKAKSKLYFKFFTKINNDKIWEYVPGYASIMNSGICPNNSTYGYVQVKLEQRDKQGSAQDVNPFSKAAWNFTRHYMPRVASGYDDSQLSGGGLRNMANAMLSSSLVRSLINTMKGPDGDLRSKNYGQQIKLGKSWIRLQNPVHKKLGGGCRVKAIRIWDEWNAMTTGSSNPESSSDYGQEYSYTKLENGQVISSGVASYEPLIGGDENPFRQPVSFSDKALLGPKTENYLELPFGESFFPAASVGYSQVTVTDLSRGTDFKRHATGKTVLEFYTARDFPTIVQYTSLQPLRDKTNGISQLLGVGLRDFMSASQGYVIELNDMHGKQKSSWVYASGQSAPISGVEYKYEETVAAANVAANAGTSTVPERRLNNLVETINVNGTVETREIGVETDVINDFRESGSYTSSMGLHGNLALFVVSVLPLSVPMILPSASSTENRFRSAVTTKVVNRFGILRETIVHDLGSTVSTSNLAYDAETGDVLLTRTANEFEDAVYNFKYPAHWMYEGMGQAYKNIGLRLTLTANASGGVTSPHLVPGDELVSTAGQKIWVADNDPATAGVFLINNLGLPVTGNITAKITRSGRRNQQQTAIGTVTSMTNPIVGNVLKFDQATQIVASSAVEFSENWRPLCSGFSTAGEGYGLAPDMIKFLSGNNPSGSYVMDFFPTDGGPSVAVSDNNFNVPDYQPVVPYATPGPLTSIYCVGGVLKVTSKYTALLVDRSARHCGDTVNPYLVGMRGNFRSLKSWTHLKARNYSASPTTDPNQRKDGVFSAYTPFWNFTAGKWAINVTNWTSVAEITAFSPYGLELESKDALGRYSAQLLGYNNTFVKAIGSNADYNQIAFDGFEDYKLEKAATDCCSGHFNFKAYEAQLETTESHTGRYSMRIGTGTSNFIAQSAPLRNAAPVSSLLTIPFVILPQDMIGNFGPKTYNSTSPQKYVLSYWVKKQNLTNSAVFDYPDLSCTVKNGASNYVTSTVKSKLIEGWQRVEVLFTIPASQAGSLDIRFTNAGSTNHYVDDVRIHPFNGSLKSYVYDPVSFRLWAELDERNFATFYEYDEEGKLLRVKQETARGIYTTNESRKGTSKR
jgi:hypothetical protein